MKLKIKNINGVVMIEGQYESLIHCLLKNKNDLRNADLRKANLSGADLSGADLSNANLSGANLSGADLSKANLSGADLSNADLSNANLWNVDLWNVDLWNANLSNANLSNANLNGEKLFKPLLFIYGFKYSVMISMEQMKIGCEIHRIDDWINFNDQEIIKMDGRDGLDWWNKHKTLLIDTINFYKK